MGNCALDALAPLWWPNFVQVARLDGTTTVTLCGELDLCTAPRVRLCFEDFEGDVRVDCAGLTFMDAAGVTLLLEMQQQCRLRGVKLIVMNPALCVTRLMSLVHLDDAFTVQCPVSEQ